MDATRKNTSVFLDGALPYVGDLSHAETRRGGEFFSRKERKDHKAGGPTSVSATIDRSGWKRVRLGEVLTYEQPYPYIVHKAEYVSNGTPVLTPGKTFILGYTTETDGICRASSDAPCILFDDFLTISRLVQFDFKVKSSAVKILLPASTSHNLRFIFYAMSRLQFEITDHQRHWINQFSKLEIQVPTRQEQDRIADAIDSIDTHISALQSLIAKYEAIKKATVNLLLKPKAGWRQISLGDIGDVLMCKRILKNQTTETGDVPFYKIGTFGRTPDSFISRALFKDFKARFSYPQKGDVLLSAAGTIGRTVVFNGEDAYFQDSNIVWIDNDERIVTNRFLHVLYDQLDWQTENGGTVSRLYNANIRNTKIVIPTLTEQRRIVTILDSIDSTIKGFKSQISKAQGIKQGMMTYFFG